MDKFTKLGILLVSASLCACSTKKESTFVWDEYLNATTSLELRSEKFTNFVLADAGNIDNDLSEIEKIVEDKGSTSVFVSKMNALDSKTIKIVQSYIIAQTKYYADADESYKTKSEDYYSKYVKISTFITKLEEKIYNSSKGIKDAYFGDMSEEEIQERLANNASDIIETEYSEIFKGLQDKGDELYSQFAKDGQESTFLSKGYDIILEYIDAANEFISKTKYDNYLDYSYRYDYSRDYTYSDAEPFIKYVKKYLVPIYINKDSIKTPSTVNRNKYKYLTTTNFCNSATDSAAMFTSYAEDLGGQYLDAYNNAFNNGYYCFSSNVNSMATAYQWSLPGMNDAVLYFSKNYQDVFTITHEFGHYYSCYVNNGARKNDAYDLQETYSQGNEYVFMNYLLEQKKDDKDAATYEYIRDSRAYEEIRSIILQAGIAEIENFIFNTPDLTKATLRSGVEKILASYNGTSSSYYFMAAILTSPCYYISYATSLMEALQFSTMSYEDSKTAYKKLIESNEKLSMVERWKNAGLASPFEEETFQTVSGLFTSIAEKY